MHRVVRIQNAIVLYADFSQMRGERYNKLPFSFEKKSQHAPDYCIPKNLTDVTDV